MNGSSRLLLRDIGILAHIDAGKTSLTERILFVSGRIRSPGDIDEGTTVTDYLQVERERGITVKAAAAHFEWVRALSGSTSSFRINLIDTPGHVDFSSEVGRSLHALDGAVVLVCAVAGVQSRTEALYRACARRGVSRLAFINKMDRRGASFEQALEDIVHGLDPGAVAIQLPWGEGEGFHGVVDLVDMAAYDFSPGSVPLVAAGATPGSVPKRPVALPIPEELATAAAQARSALVEALAGGIGGSSGPAEGDQALLEDFVAGRSSPPARLRAALRAATLAGRATPVLCGSAFSDSSAALLLDAVADYLPSPSEGVRPVGTDPSTGASIVLGPDAPFSALVFKTGGDQHFGRLSWIRVRSGRIVAGDKVLDVGAGKQLRITRIFGIQADRLEAADGAEDGDIVALALGGSAGVQGSAGATGATLCDPRRPILYEPIGFGEPVMSIALEPRTRADGDRLRSGAAALVEEDPSIRLREDPQTGRIELAGMGELHLDVAVERLARDYGVGVRVGRPRVAYRELIGAPAEAAEEFDRDLGGERVRATVALRIGPRMSASGAAGPVERPFSFTQDAAVRVASSLLEAARRGAEAALSVGPSAGFPLEGARVVLEKLVLPGGSISAPGKAMEHAVEIAASLAASKALRAAGTEVVEPVMRLEITVPEAFLGAAAAAVSRRGGRIESLDSSPGGGSVLSGAAPLRCLFGFAGELRSATEGRAEYAARFSRFEAVPPGFSDFG
jgi:elongation factor G